MEPVKCVTCGYLAVGSDEGDSPLVGLVYRQTCQRSGSGEYSDPAPRCFVLAQQIREEYQDRLNESGATSNDDKRKVALEVTRQDRLCAAFFAFRSGCTPKEHVMLNQIEVAKRESEERQRADTERAEQRRREDEKLAQKRLEEDREWRRNEEANRRQWQEKESRYQRWFQTIVTVVVLVLGALLTIVVEPWKLKQEPRSPMPPQIIVNIPPEALKK